MSKAQIEVITYEQDRLNYFTDLMKKAQKRYNRLFKKFKNAPYLSEEAEKLSDAGREAHFHGDVVEMLEKGYRKQSEGEWMQRERNTEAMKAFHEMGIGLGMSVNSIYYTCSICNKWGRPQYNYCPQCGAKMKGGAE